MTPPSVSEEMIRAREAVAAYFKSVECDALAKMALAGTYDNTSQIGVVLHVLAHLPAVSEAVKPLERERDEKAGVSFAETNIGDYSAYADGTLEFNGVQLSFVKGRPQHETEAVAQANFERRVRSCLAPPSTPPAANVQEQTAKLVAGGHGELWVRNYLVERSEAMGHEIDDDEIAESARDIYAALRSKQAPTVAVPDEADELDLAQIIEDELKSWQGSNGAVHTIHAAALGISIAIRCAFLRARAEQRETPSVVVGETVIAAFNAMWIRPPTADDYWKVVPSSGKPLLYGAMYQGLLAHGTIATWKEFDFIVAVVNAMIDARAAAPTSDGR